MATVDQEQLIEADALYRHYGLPFEATHTGQYVAITRDGRTVIGPTLLQVMQEAKAAFGPGSFIFKVGERAAGKWR